MSTLSLCTHQGVGHQVTDVAYAIMSTQRKSKACLSRCRLKPLLREILKTKILVTGTEQITPLTAPHKDSGTVPVSNLSITFIVYETILKCKDVWGVNILQNCG